MQLKGVKQLDVEKLVHRDGSMFGVPATSDSLPASTVPDAADVAPISGANGGIAPHATPKVDGQVRAFARNEADDAEVVVGGIAAAECCDKRVLIGNLEALVRHATCDKLSFEARLLILEQNTRGFIAKLRQSYSSVWPAIPELSEEDAVLQISDLACASLVPAIGVLSVGEVQRARASVDAVCSAGYSEWKLCCLQKKRSKAEADKLGMKGRYPAKFKGVSQR